MTIETISKQNFILKNEDHKNIGNLFYEDNSFNKGIIESDTEFKLRLLTTGIWLTELDTKKIMETKVEIGGIISINFFLRKRKYIFRKSTNWKIRFSLSTNSGDEILSLIPSLNWQKESHNFILQLNEEFEQEYNSLLILQALHCANCSLSMMQGGAVPALISL